MAQSKPPRKKSGKNTIMIAAALGMFLLLAVVLIFNGADLGQSKIQKAQAKKEKEAQAKTYSEKIPDPDAATKARLAKAQEDARLKQLELAQKQVSSRPALVPPVPSAIPMPPGTQLNYDRLAQAQKSIQAGAAKYGSSKSDTEDDSGSSGSTDFVMYTAGASGSGGANPRGVLASLRMQNGSNSSGQQDADAKYKQQIAQENPDDNAAVKADKAQLAAYKANAQAQAAGRSQAPSDSNSAWLYSAQNQAVKETTGDIVATRGKALYWMAPGTTINAVLLSAVNTLLPGHIVARVTQNIYDSRYGRYLVIPAGSTLEGEYNSSVKDGQDRVLMAFDTLVTPSGAIVRLGNMNASDALGRAGIHGVLHTHFWKRMGISTLMAVEAIGMDRLSPSQTTVSSGSSTTSPAATAGQIISNTANQELQRRYSVRPNITLSEGAPMTIITTGGIDVPPIANTR